MRSKQRGGAMFNAAHGNEDCKPILIPYHRLLASRKQDFYFFSRMITLHASPYTVAYEY
jgi:hypothetical protein